MAKKFKMYLGGKWLDSKNRIRVTNPYDNTLTGTVAAASKEDFTKAIDFAHKTFAITRELPSYKREQTPPLKSNISSIITIGLSAKASY